MQSNASNEFISDDYPLVYKRSCKEQTITVIINVKDEKTTVENGKCEVEPCSAVFVEE